MTDVKLGSQSNIHVTDCTSDIRVLDDEIVMGYEDFELVKSNECLIQDVRSKLLTHFGTLYYDEKYGSGLLLHIQADKSDITLRQIKQDIRIALKEDERIDPNSIKVEVRTTEVLLRPWMDKAKVSFDTSSEKLGVMIEFNTIEGNELSMNLSL